MDKVFVGGGELIFPGNIDNQGILVENGQIYIINDSFQPSQVPSIHDSQQKLKDEKYSFVDAKGCYVTPGLFDLQVNGSPKCNLWADPTINEFSQLCQGLLKTGTTAFLPTLITDDLSHMHKNIEFLKSMGAGKQADNYQSDNDSAGQYAHPAIRLINMPGIHLEGPFLSPEKSGVHPKQYVRALHIQELQELAKPPVKLVTLAPELENGQLAISYLIENGIKPSLGHSNATFNEAMDSFNVGIHMVTHTFNAMTAIHQRKPGAAIAGLLAKEVYCCVIADGLHVDPNMIKLLVEMKGIDKVILVTDMASIGTTSGELVGASITLSQAVTNIVNWGIASFPEAIQMATLNPARAMGLDHRLGRIRNGSRADLVIWDKQTHAIKHVIAGGHVVH